MNKIPEGYANLSLEEKRVLLAKLLREKASQAPSEYPLSYGQRALWFLYQLEPESVAYNIVYAARLEADLDIQALRRAFESLVSRHPILRTTYTTRSGKPVAVIGQPTIDLEVTTTSDWSDDYFNHWLTEVADRPFDLERDAVVRGNLLVRSAVKEHIFLLTAHHIALDFFSVEVLINELSMLYQAIKRGIPPSLPPLGGSFQDYVRWENEMLAGAAGERLAAYWQKQLAGPLPVLNLPTDRPRPAVQSYEGASFSFELDEKLTRQLSRLAKAAGVTLYMTLLAAFEVLLLRYTDQEDILIGSPMGGRTRTEFERTVGHFVNPVTLRADLSGNPTFKGLLHRVRETVLGAIKHQSYPYPLLVERLQPVRDPSRAPLFQVMFIWDQLRESEVEKRQATERDGLIAKSLLSEQRGADFDLTLTIFNTGGPLTGTWEYKSDLFSADTVTRMGAHFQTLLEEIVANPERPVRQFPLLSAAERHQLLVTWNQTQVSYPADKCFHQLFEEQVAKSPEAIAAVFGESQLTYRELNQRANRLARVLVAQGVGPDLLVPLLLNRNLDFLIAMIAVFKAGGAYLPLNPRSPAKRIGRVLAQSKASLLLTSSHFAPLLSQARAECPQGTEPKVLLIEALQQQAEASFDGASENQNLPVRCMPNNLAYVIYTSGSTGVPKGAMVEQKGMLNHLYAKIWDLELTSADIIAQTAPQSFDISVWQFLTALLVGGRVHILSDEIAADPTRLLSCVEADIIRIHEGISILEVVPSLLRMMLEEVTQGWGPNLSTLRWLIPTGEALPPNLCRQWFEHYPTIPMLNAYGPTECSDDVTHYPIYEPPAPEVLNMPIGRPVANMQMYILDQALQPVPIGVAGELYVGGVGVGRGYLNDAERTAPAFIQDPFTKDENARLYKTGDLARYLPDGNIEFLGRLDYQVKIRGFRIELGEIEAVLAEHPAVAQAVVIDQEEQAGDKRLVAYVIPASAAESNGQKQDPTRAAAKSELRGYLRKNLPDYMVPAAFVILDTLPLTPNGKVDRRALPAPDLSYRDAQQHIVAPRTPTEEALAGIWASVLGDHTPVGIHDNFFELGGHSLLATQVVSRLRREFNMNFNLRLFFEKRTVADLAEYIDTTRWAAQATATGMVEEREEGAL